MSTSIIQDQSYEYNRRIMITSERARPPHFEFASPKRAFHLLQNGFVRGFQEFLRVLFGLPRQTPHCPRPEFPLRPAPPRRPCPARCHHPPRCGTLCPWRCAWYHQLANLLHRAGNKLLSAKTRVHRHHQDIIHHVQHLAQRLHRRGRIDHHAHLASVLRTRSRLDSDARVASDAPQSSRRPPRRTPGCTGPGSRSSNGHRAAALWPFAATPPPAVQW